MSRTNFSFDMQDSDSLALCDIRRLLYIVARQQAAYDQLDRDDVSALLRRFEVDRMRREKAKPIHKEGRG